MATAVIVRMVKEGLPERPIVVIGASKDQCIKKIIEKGADCFLNMGGGFELHSVLFEVAATVVIDSSASIHEVL